MSSLLFLAVALAGCGGVEPVGVIPPEPDPGPPIALAGPLNTASDAGGNARYLGEITNTGDVVACGVNLSINSFDQSGNLLNDPSSRDFNFGDVLGDTFRFSPFAPQMRDNCIPPGSAASFDLRTNVRAEDVASSVVDIPCAHEELYEGCIARDQPFAEPTARLRVSGEIIEDAPTGRMRYTGVVLNDSPSGSGAAAHHVKIVVTAKNAAGLIVDVACAAMDGVTCPPAPGAPGPALNPQELWTFAVTMSIPPSATCPRCFSYKINQKEP